MYSVFSFELPKCIHLLNGYGASRRKFLFPEMKTIAICDEFIYNHLVDATAGGDLFPLGYHKPSSQHFIVLT